MLFKADYQTEFLTNTYVQSVDTRDRSSLYLPFLRLSCVQEWAIYCGFKTLNSVPINIQSHRYDWKVLKTQVTYYFFFLFNYWFF